MGGYARDPLKYIFLAGVSVIKGGELCVLHKIITVCHTD